MQKRDNILSYFENILKSIRTMEKNARIFSELSTIVDELKELERYVKTIFQTVDHYYQSYLDHVTLLSDLVDFQQKIAHFLTPAEALDNLVEFLRVHIPVDEGFLYLRYGEEEGEEIIPLFEESKDVVHEFLTEQNYRQLQHFLMERDLAIVLNNLEEHTSFQPGWDTLKARSAILIPLRIRGRFQGVGVLIRRDNVFDLTHLSFVNLLVGIINLLMFQHYYFYYLRRRLFKELKYRKILEEIEYAEYLEKGPLLFFILDTRGTILQTNKSVIRKLRLDENQIVGTRIFSLLPEDNRTSFQNLINKLRAGDIAFFKSPIYVDESDEFILEFYISRTQLSDDVDFLVILAVDATTEYHREQLERRNAILNELSDFSEKIYGQVQNTLNIAVPHLSVLNQKIADDNPLKKNILFIEESLSDLSTMMQHFLNYGLQEVESPVQTNLNDIIKEFVSEFSADVPSRIQLKYSLAPGLPATLLFPERVRQLLRILIQNSIEAIPDKGDIFISTRKISQRRDGLLPESKFFLEKGEYIELSVEDTGVGIKPEILPNIFKPFFSTKIKNKMMGLGLFIAYQIVYKMGGDIFVESTPGKGSRFSAFLPIKGEDSMYEVVPRMAEEKPLQTSKILIVDDEFNIRNMLKEILEMNHFEVLTAGNGQEGVELFKHHADEIELVILDMVMPVMDGRQAFQYIRKIKPNQKVLVISGYAKRENLDEILKYKTSSFLSKPFQIDEILDAIHRMLGRN